MCSASCRAVGTQAIPPSNHPIFRLGMPVQDAGEHVLGELFAERVDIHHHADDDAVVLARSLGWGLTDVVADRHAGRLDLVPDRVHFGAAVVVDVAVVVLAGVERQQERLQAKRLQLFQRASGAFRIPPVDQPDAVEVPLAALLQVGDVLVVDAEHALAQRLVRVVEQRQHSVGEREFLVDAVFVRVRGCGRRCCSTPRLPDRRTASAHGRNPHRSTPCPSCRPCTRRPRTRSAAPHPSVPRGSARRRCRRPPRCGCRRRRSRCPRAGRSRPVAWPLRYLGAPKPSGGYRVEVGVDIVGTPIGLWCKTYQLTGSSYTPYARRSCLNGTSSNGTASLRVGMRRSSVWNTICSSARASCCPTHWCRP